MLSSLVDLFTAISDFEQIPSDWQTGIFKSIHKSGSLFELDNYRGITLSSNVYKVFSKVIEEKIVSYLEDNNILGESQGAFGKNRRLAANNEPDL
jgi:inhibitor of KinA sporulation pathway (predicted exonuclease)